MGFDPATLAAVGSVIGGLGAAGGAAQQFIKKKPKTGLEDKPLAAVRRQTASGSPQGILSPAPTARNNIGGF